MDKIGVVNKLQINKIKGFTSKEIPTESEPISTPKDLKSPDISTLQAYNKISFTGNPVKIIQKADFIQYLQDTNVKRPDLFEDIYNAVCNGYSELTEEAFNIFKKFQEKKHLIWDTTKIFNAVKENGKINYKALNLVENMVEPSKLYYHKINYAPLISKHFRDSSGKLNEQMIEIMQRDPKTFGKYMEMRPESVFGAVKDAEGNFNNDALNYFSKQLDENKKIGEIINDLYSAKTPEGGFDISRISLIKDLKENFCHNEVLRVKDAALRVPTEQRAQVINIAKSIKDEKYFDSILDNMESLNLEFNEANINFAKKLSEISYGKSKKIDIIAKKIKLSPETWNEKTENLVAKLSNMFDDEELNMVLEAGTYKVGKHKGETSLDNIEKYLDIYKVRRGFGTEYIKKIASRFALEEDDKAITVFHKLLTREFPSKNSPNKMQLLDIHKIDFIMELATHSINDIPKIKCLENVLEHLEKLLQTKFATQSKEMFEGFMTVPRFDEIAKLERVNLAQVGISPENSTIFCNCDENEILKFKNFLAKYRKENNLDKLKITINRNIKDRIEITSTNKNCKDILLYDFAKQQPITNIQVKEIRYNLLEKTQRDYTNNTETSLLLDLSGICNSVQSLRSQTIKYFDKSGKELYREITEKSPVKGILNSKIVTPDGKEKIISSATYDYHTGYTVIHKDMDSIDGTRTLFHYETDNSGNVISDYTITSKEGKELMKRSFAFEKIDENHFKTSKNGRTYDVTITDETFAIKNEKTGETRNLNMQTLLNGTDKNIVELLKSVPGDELFKMDELGLKNIIWHKYYNNASFNPDTKTITLSDDNDSLSTLMHEWGHAKDCLFFKEIGKEICDDPELLRIYNEEREAFRKHFSEPQLDFINYLAGDIHYLGKKAIREGIGDTNSLLNSLITDNVQSLRSHYWQQHFPKTIAYLSKLLD